MIHQGIVISFPESLEASRQFCDYIALMCGLTRHDDPTAIYLLLVRDTVLTDKLRQLIG